MPDRVVKVQLVIDEHGAVKAVHNVGEESSRTEGKLSHLDKGVKGLGKSFGGLKSLALGGLGALGVGGVAFGLSSIATKTKEVATETEKFHSITGIGTASSLAYTQALKARGLSGESVTKAFGFLAKNIKSAELQEQKFSQTQATATAKGKVSTTVLGRQATALKELGINLADFNRLSEPQKLEQITKKFEAMAPGMQKTRLERELFGRGGNQLSTVLEKNNLGLTHQIELVKKFFPTIKGGANSMNELLEKQAESKMAWEGLEFTIGQKLVPLMISLMGTFSKVVQEVEQGKGTWGELRNTLQAIVGVGKEIWSIFEGLVGKSNALKIAVGGLLGVLVVGKIVAFAGALKALGGLSFLGLKGNLATALGPLLAAAAAAESIKKSADVKHPAKAPSQGPLGDIGGFLSGGLVGNPATSPINVGRSLVENLSPATHHGRGPGAGLTGSVEAGTTNIHLHLDSTKVAEAIIKNPRGRRLISESATIHAQGMVARK